MRPETEGWRRSQRRGRWWTVVLVLATMTAIVVAGWPEWVAIVRCLWRKECF